MQHRNTYQPRNTPSFSIEESTSDSLSTPPPTSASFIPSSSLPSSNGNGESSYFMNNDKQLLPSSSNNPYPPPHSSRSPTRTHFTPPTNSSVHLPLLHDQEPTSSSPNSSLEDPIPIHSRRHFSNPQSSNASSIPIHHTRSNSNKGGGGGAAGNWLRSLIVTRTRLHPLVLVPVFLFGVICAATFGGGSGNGRESLGRSAMSSLKNLKNGLYSARPSLYTLHSSGHLFLSPSSLLSSSSSTSQRTSSSIRHPILDLIHNATLSWESKLSRQSTTLEQAVKEYKRRFNGRKPPKGFDKWFEFAQENEVVLIDEFDSTFRDVELFYALPPKVIRERAEKLQSDQSTFTMEISPGSGGKVEISGAHKEDGRAKDQKKLMERWSKFVVGGEVKGKDGKLRREGVNITMAAHDGPSVMMDERGRMRHLQAARQGKYLKEDEYEEVNEDAALWGFPLACPANSRLRRAYDGLEIDNLPKGPSFVADHKETMNLCSNPEWQYLHGFTSWPGMRPQILRPLFSFAKTSLHSDILLTPLEQYWDKEPWDPSWEEKKYNKAVWRGSTTGVWFDRGTWWRSSQRVRLWFMGQDSTGVRNVRFSGEGLETPVGVESLVEKQVPTMDLMQRYVDFAFTGREGQCSEEDGSCQAVRDTFEFQRTFGWNEANEYKYMLDLDGNAWSGRFHRLLSTNSAVLKSTIFPEWYAGWIQPWVHYIPIKIDYTDLFDVLAFFSGDLDGQNHHEQLAKQIAQNGKDYTERFWRYADMEAYFFRLTLEWARVSAYDRDSMDYDGPGA
ncbi:hypothetical protein JCM5353_006163 [Sporobolomyces roseus]